MSKKDTYAKRWDALTKRRFDKAASKMDDADFIENVLDDNGMISDGELARKFLIDHLLRKELREKEHREPPRPRYVADIKSLTQLEHGIFGSFGDPIREKVLLSAVIHLNDKPTLNEEVLVEYKGIWMVFRFGGLLANPQVIVDDMDGSRHYFHSSMTATVHLTFVRFL